MSPRIREIWNLEEILWQAEMVVSDVLLDQEHLEVWAQNRHRIILLKLLEIEL